MKLTIEARRLRWRIATRKYQAAHPDRISRPTPERAAEYSRNWRKRHPEKSRASATLQNRKFGKERCRQYRQRKIAENPRFYADRIAAWRKKHPKEWNAIAARAKRKRYQNSPHHRIAALVSRSITRAVAKKKALKSARTLALLGIDIPEFMAWIESQFRDGMNWANMGKFGWHIDHVIPCASFDLSKSEDQKKCFHYTNLQPLWWRENLSKGAKIL